MKPLNYAMLKFMTTAGTASVDDVMKALKGNYENYKAFNKDELLRAMLTAEVNGLLEETGYDLDDNNEIRVFFKAHDEGKATINKYIRD